MTSFLDSTTWSRTDLGGRRTHALAGAPPGHGQTSAFARLAPRITGDILSVAAGFGFFDAITGHVSATQLLLGLCYVLVAAVVDVTHVRREWSRVEEVILAVKVALVALVTTTTVVFLDDLKASRITFLSVTAAMIVIRPVLAYSSHRLESRDFSPRTVVVVCDDDEYVALLDAIADRKIAPLRIVARLATAPDNPGGWTSDVEDLCWFHRPWRLTVGKSGFGSESVGRALSSVNEAGVTVRSLPRLFEEEFGRVPIDSVDWSWFLFDIGAVHRVGYRAARRAIDIAAAVATGFLLLLLVPFIAAAVRLDSRGPVLFRQTRVGQHGVPFVLLKFRTMQVDAEAGGPAWATPCDARVTRVGRFLRKSRLDELPQALNLLRAEMSLIGPRPERPEFVDQLAAEVPYFNKRQLMKPGITGWAQVHEGYGSSVEDMRRKLERDLYYLKYQSFGLDLRVMAATVANILQLQGR